MGKGFESARNGAAARRGSAGAAGTKSLGAEKIAEIAGPRASGSGRYSFQFQTTFPCTPTGFWLNRRRGLRQEIVDHELNSVICAAPARSARSRNSTGGAQLDLADGAEHHRAAAAPPPGPYVAPAEYAVRNDWTREEVLSSLPRRFGHAAGAIFSAGRSSRPLLRPTVRGRSPPRAAWLVVVALLPSLVNTIQIDWVGAPPTL